MFVYLFVYLFIEENYTEKKQPHCQEKSERVKLFLFR